MTFKAFDDVEGELNIRNKLSLYAIAIDKDDFNTLDQVFTQDVLIDYKYPGGPTLNGLPAAKEYFTKALTGFNTQHTVSTITVEKGPEGDAEAISTAYIVGWYLGQESLTGQAATIHGYYEDEWVKKGKDYLSRKRTLTIFVSPLELSHVHALIIELQDAC